MIEVATSLSIGYLVLMETENFLVYIYENTGPIIVCP
jgi:hypothetical protein